MRGVVKDLKALVTPQPAELLAGAVKAPAHEVADVVDPVYDALQCCDDARRRRIYLDEMALPCAEIAVVHPGGVRPSPDDVAPGIDGSGVRESGARVVDPQVGTVQIS